MNLYVFIRATRDWLCFIDSWNGTCVGVGNCRRSKFDKGSIIGTE